MFGVKIKMIYEHIHKIHRRFLKSLVFREMKHNGVSYLKICERYFGLLVGEASLKENF